VKTAESEFHGRLHDEAVFYHDKVLRGTMQSVREVCDELESVIDDRLALNV
jgi:hypothetical protein